MGHEAMPGLTFVVRYICGVKQQNMPAPQLCELVQETGTDPAAQAPGAPHPKIRGVVCVGSVTQQICGAAHWHDDGPAASPPAAVLPPVFVLPVEFVLPPVLMLPLVFR